MLREIEGLSTAEAAEALGLPEPAVKTRLHRAKAQLRHQPYASTQEGAGALFPFGGARCNRIVAAVFAQLREGA